MRGYHETPIHIYDIIQNTKKTIETTSHNLEKAIAYCKKRKELTLLAPDETEVLVL